MQTERFPLVVKQARIRSGAFVGCYTDHLASALDIADANATAAEISKQDARSIFGVFARESRGLRNLGWYRNGERI